MLDKRETVLDLLMRAERYARIQAPIDAQKGEMLQRDAAFMQVHDAPVDQFDPMPLWRAICLFRKVDPDHWAVRSLETASLMQRHTFDDVADRLKGLVNLHKKALGQIETGKLRVIGDASKGYRTTFEWLNDWAEKIGLMVLRPDPLGETQTAPATPTNESETQPIQGALVLNGAEWRTKAKPKFTQPTRAASLLSTTRSEMLQMAFEGKLTAWIQLDVRTNLDGDKLPFVVRTGRLFVSVRPSHLDVVQCIE